MTKSTLWFDGNAFLGKNGISRDGVQMKSRLYENYQVHPLNWPLLPGISPNLTRKLLNWILVLTGWSPTLPSRFSGIFYQQQFGPLHGRADSTWIIRTHDLFPITNPEWFHWWSVKAFTKSFNVALASSATFCCNSEATKEVLINMFPDAAGRVTVVRCEVTALQSNLCMKCDGCKWHYSQTKSNYIIAVGTLEPRKNYGSLLQIWKGEKRFDLVLIGKKGWKCRKIVNQLKDSSLSTHWVENCCDGALNLIYSRATAFISTSFSEGFNLPALEARQLYGLPLLLSDIPAHREMHEDYANFFSSEGDAILALNRL